MAPRKGARAQSSLSALQLKRWQTAFRKALEDYGSRRQAEMIAWGAIDESLQHPKKSGGALTAPPSRRRKAA